MESQPITEAVRDILTRHYEQTRETAPGVLHALLDDLNTLVQSGKFMRAHLAYCAWRYADTSPDADIQPIAHLGAAFEVVHSAALIQDDIVDCSLRRRGLPTLHVTHTLAEALGASAVSYSWQNELLAHTTSSLDTLTTLQRICATAYRETALGSLLEFHAQEQRDYSLATARQIHYLKTARYSTYGPMACGSVIAHADPSQYEEYAQAVAMGGQAANDLHDTYGNPNQPADTTGDDIRSGKPTLLIAHALRLATTAQRTELTHTYGRTEIDPRQVRDVITETGAREACAQDIADCLAAALKSARGPEMAAIAHRALAY
ncbi:polyprenyl synthetase family protein [Streptomyces sp. NPDC001667]